MSSRCDGLLSATSGVPGAFNTSSCTPALAVYVSACPRNSTQQSLLPVQSCKLLEPVQLSIFFVTSAQLLNIRACRADCLPSCLIRTQWQE